MKKTPTVIATSAKLNVVGHNGILIKSTTQPLKILSAKLAIPPPIIKAKGA